MDHVTTCSISLTCQTVLLGMVPQQLVFGALAITPTQLGLAKRHITHVRIYSPARGLSNTLPHELLPLLCSMVQRCRYLAQTAPLDQAIHALQEAITLLHQSVAAAGQTGDKRGKKHEGWNA
jgi:hypothetical protein